MFDRDAIAKVVTYYETKEGKAPFLKWFTSVKNKGIQTVIDARIARVRLGNFGDSRSLGKNIYELRIHISPGIRIYYGLAGDKIVLLLSGGFKKSQSQDILKAREYWQEYNERKNEK